MKKCIVCKEEKDEWEQFTKTEKDETHYEGDVCKLCRIKQLGEKLTK